MKWGFPTFVLLLVFLRRPLWIRANPAIGMTGFVGGNMISEDLGGGGRG